MSGVVIEIIFINDLGGAHQVPVESLPLVRPKSRDMGGRGLLGPVLSRETHPPTCGSPWSSPGKMRLSEPSRVWTWRDTHPPGVQILSKNL